MTQPNICIFDAGTSDAGSLSMKFPSDQPWFQAAGGRPGAPALALLTQTTSSFTRPMSKEPLPRHRTLSGGLLFTLPEHSNRNQIGDVSVHVGKK